MALSYEQVQERIDHAAAQLFGVDPRVHSVGIARGTDGFHFRAVRNARALVAAGTRVHSPRTIDDVPVQYIDAYRDLEPLLKVPCRGPGSSGQSSCVQEQQRNNAACCGLEVHNFDYDDREAHIKSNYINVGTLGCFIKISDGTVGLLSNNHVIAGENKGKRGDRILQPGNGAFQAAHQLATLHDWVRLLPSSSGARPPGVVFNEVDAAIALLQAGAHYSQGYLSYHKQQPLQGSAAASDGDAVFKVGRTTALTRGEVVSTSTLIGPVKYELGECWFRNSIEIEGQWGTQFSNKGDSGAAIVRTTGEVVGLLYATNGLQTYACPMDSVVTSLSCSIA